MKCMPGKNLNDTCRRCHRAGLPCVFVPRANAAALPELTIDSLDRSFKRDVLRRLKDIEGFIGIASMSSHTAVDTYASDEGADGTSSADDGNLESLWKATKILQECSPKHVPTTIWRKSLVKSLWSSCVHLDYLLGP